LDPLPCLWRTPAVLDCLPQAVPEPVCLDVQGLPVETFVSSLGTPAMPGVVLSWEGGDADVRWESSPFQGLDHRLQLPAGARLEFSRIASWTPPASHCLSISTEAFRISTSPPSLTNRVGYFTVTPCRLLDTRSAEQGPVLLAGTIRTFPTAPERLK
jgi:hypothetical protein